MGDLKRARRPANGGAKKAKDNDVDELFIAQLRQGADQSLEISFKPLILFKTWAARNRDGVLGGRKIAKNVEKADRKIAKYDGRELESGE